MAEHIVEIENLSFEYQGEKRGDSTLALENINMFFDEGDFVCLLGPSGCGKSTLLNILAGFLKPTSGRALVKGEEPNGVDYHRAVVFQAPVMYPWLDTYDNVAFGPKVRGVPKDEIARKVNEYLELVGLSDFAHSKPYELSGGMRQRAALARELVNDPFMLLLDEPFGALDALTRENMQKLLRDIWIRDSKTILLITHDVDEALLLGNKIYVMSARPGRVAEELHAGFTYAMAKGDTEVRYTPEYIAMRKEALDLITVANS